MRSYCPNAGISLWDAVFVAASDHVAYWHLECSFAGGDHWVCHARGTSLCG